MTSPTGSLNLFYYTLILLQMGSPGPGPRPGASLRFDSHLGLPETPPIVILAIRREAHLQQLARAEGLSHALQEALLCIQDGDGSLTGKGNRPPAWISLSRISGSLLLMCGKHMLHEGDQPSMPMPGDCLLGPEGSPVNLESSQRKHMEYWVI